MSIHNEQITQCIISGFNTLKDISSELSLSRSAIRHALENMVIEGLIEFQKIGKCNVYTLVKSQSLHDPFGLCRTPSKSKTASAGALRLDAKAGLGERRTHLLEDTRRGASAFDGDGSKYARSYGQPKQLRDLM